MKQVGSIRSIGIIALLTAVFVCLIAGLPFMAVAADQQPQAQKKTILILNAYHKGYKWTEDETTGIESVFKGEGAPSNVEVLVEYLDTKRVSGAEYFKQLSEVYRQRFASRKVDVVVTTDDDALNFMLDYRDKIMPGVPVVFCGVNDYFEGRVRGQKGITGVNEAGDVKDNIDLILKVHPDVRKILFITDQTSTGQRVRQSAQTIIPNYSDMVKFEFTDELDMPQIIDKVKGLPASSAVLFTFFSKDKAGKFFEFSDSAMMITQASPVPVYSVWDFNLGYGVVGGKLTNGISQGRAAGEMAMRILNGENADNIPVLMKSPNKYIFDYPVLDKYKIKPTMMPAESSFINKPKYTMTHVLLGVIGLVLVAGVVFVYKKVI